MLIYSQSIQYNAFPRTELALGHTCSASQIGKTQARRRGIERGGAKTTRREHCSRIGSGILSEAEWALGSEDHARRNDLSYHTPGIERTPDVCGGSACIVRTRIPVWLLVEAQQNGATEAQLLTSFPSLRAEDLTNAWAYKRGNKAEIDAEVLENEAV